MSNTYYTKAVSTKNPLVISFDLKQNVKTYSLGVCQLHQQTLKPYSTPVCSFTINRNDVKWNSSLGGSQESYYGKIMVYNTEGYLLGNKIHFIQQTHKTNKYYSTSSATDTKNIVIYDSTSETQEQVALENLDLSYKCYINTDQFSSQNGELIFIQEQFYETNFEVIPFTCQTQNQQIIILDNSQNELVFLGLDYGVVVDPEINKIVTIASYQNGVIKETDYIKGVDYNRVRFVVSDGGRILSHAVHEKDSKEQFSQNMTKKFETNNRERLISIKFEIDNNSSISNITSNF